MTTILVGDCKQENLFQIWDANAIRESEFELLCAKTLMCLYPNYRCFPFGGTFEFEGTVSRPDIALVANDLSHWFVIEVELVSHSLERHVVPQVQTFRYGSPQRDCISVLSKALGLERPQIETFLATVPRFVAVVVNKHNKKWDAAFRLLQVQLLTVSAFESPAGVQAVEVDGQLVALKEHVGFGQYMAVDRALRFPIGIKLPDGEIMVDDFEGAGSVWTVKRDGAFAWITKNQGTPDISDYSYVQVIKSFGGRFLIRRPPF